MELSTVPKFLEDLDAKVPKLIFDGYTRTMEKAVQLKTSYESETKCKFISLAKQRCVGKSLGEWVLVSIS